MGVRTMTFPDAAAKAAWLDGAARADALHWRVRLVADRALVLYPSPLSRAVALHALVRDCIGYSDDPGLREEFADSSVVLQRGYDDCDGKARLFVALCRASGLEAAIRPVFPRPDDFEHVQAEVWWPGSARHPRASPEGRLVAELCLADVPLGAGVEAARARADGTLVLA